MGTGWERGLSHSIRTLPTKLITNSQSDKQSQSIPTLPARPSLASQILDDGLSFNGEVSESIPTLPPRPLFNAQANGPLGDGGIPTLPPRSSLSAGGIPTILPRPVSPSAPLDSGPACGSRAPKRVPSNGSDSGTTSAARSLTASRAAKFFLVILSSVCNVVANAHENLK